MNVLNTVNTMSDLGVALLVFAVVGAFLIVIGAATEEPIPILFGIAVAVVMISLFCVTDTEGPTQYEVTLNPGAIIDATKYEVIEQRGDIYVIEEREVEAE